MIYEPTSISLSYIYKIDENSNGSPTLTEIPSCCIIGKHAFDESTVEESLIARDALIFLFLFQHLCFVINMKKSIARPVQEIEFLELQINSLPEDKVLGLIHLYQMILQNKPVTLRKLTGLIESLF